MCCFRDSSLVEKRNFFFQFRRQADPDHTTGMGDTPAILAAAGGHLCALTELEEAGADLDRGNFAGETPLIVASTKGHVGVVAFLAGLVGTDLDRCKVASAILLLQKK